MSSFLILHKVRGEPAFDIAERLEVEGKPEPWWIIPTSGHRAYPIDWWELNKLFPGSGNLTVTQTVMQSVRDHYEQNAEPRKQLEAKPKAKPEPTLDEIASLL